MLNKMLKIVMTIKTKYMYQEIIIFNWYNLTLIRNQCLSFRTDKIQLIDRMRLTRKYSNTSFCSDELKINSVQNTKFYSALCGTKCTTEIL